MYSFGLFIPIETKNAFSKMITHITCCLRALLQFKWLQKILPRNAVLRRSYLCQEKRQINKIRKHILLNSFTIFSKVLLWNLSIHYIDFDSLVWSNMLVTSIGLNNRRLTSKYAAIYNFQIEYHKLLLMKLKLISACYTMSRGRTGVLALQKIIAQFILHSIYGANSTGMQICMPFTNMRCFTIHVLFKIKCVKVGRISLQFSIDFIKKYSKV